jgi:hypothetical protein
MAKKNFKDVTGIKFADLIMPLVMGGIGSYSPAAGRGVGLGLQAFRTFQAGQAFSDEREEKKAYKEWAEQQAQNAQAEYEQLQQGKIDPSQVATQGFHAERGPTTPVGGGEVESAVKGPQQFTLFGDDAEVAEGVDLDRGDEISEAMGAPQDLIAESLLSRKRAQDAAARDLEIARGNMTFSQALQHSAPNTGAYMSMQKVMSEQAQRAKLLGQIQMSKEYAANDKQKHKLTMMEINARDEDRQNQMRLAAELDKMGIKHWQLSGDRILEYNPERREAGMSAWSLRDEGPIDLTDVPIDERVKLFHDSINISTKLRTEEANLGESGNRTNEINQNQKVMAELWASLSNAEGLPHMYGLLEQFNAQEQAEGRQPLTMEQWMRTMGIRSFHDTPGADPTEDKKSKFMP